MSEPTGSNPAHSATVDPACGINTDPDVRRTRVDARDNRGPGRAATFLALAILTILASACVYLPRVLFDRAERNRALVSQIQIGQTPAEVRSLMGREGDKRDVRQRFDGKTVEMWSYTTDAARKLDTTITFVDGKVIEIRVTPWEEAD
jgi:hypothetical protein